MMYEAFRLGFWSTCEDPYVDESDIYEAFLAWCEAKGY